jgi:hypothetical protein
MLGALSINQYNFWFYNFTDPSTSTGILVTAGSGSKGSWYNLATALVTDVYEFIVWLMNGNATGAQRDFLVDIGIDPAGGSSYSAIISNILAHQISNSVDCGRFYKFNYFIPSGSTVGIRAQGNGANTFYAQGRFFGRPLSPHLLRAGQYSETLGVSGNGGTAITPGNSGAEGSWTSIGTTTRNLWQFNLCAGFSGTTTTAQMYYFDMAFGDASTKILIQENFPLFHPGTAERTGNPILPAYWEVPGGSNMYIRASASGTADAGCNALIVGIGG